MINLSPTPLQECATLASVIGVGNLYIKREDLHPSGSHKDRSLRAYVDKRVEEGECEFCLSSSGNLAIAAAYYAQKNPQTSFHIFVPPALTKTKRDRLHKVTMQHGDNVSVHWSRTPKADAIRLSKKKKIRLLRGSTDDGMLEGYQSLADELIEQTNGRIGNIFMAISSGTMALGLWEGLKHYKLQITHDKLPQLHIVQTSNVHPLASEFDHDFTSSKTSIASAIVDRVAHRKNQVSQAVKESGGWGWVVSDDEIIRAKLQITKLTTIDSVSSESAMSLAGLIKAIKSNVKTAEPVTLIFTGK